MLWKKGGCSSALLNSVSKQQAEEIEEWKGTEILVSKYCSQ